LTSKLVSSIVGVGSLPSYCFWLVWLAHTTFRPCRFPTRAQSISAMSALRRRVNSQTQRGMETTSSAPRPASVAERESIADVVGASVPGVVSASSWAAEGARSGQRRRTSCLLGHGGFSTPGGGSGRLGYWVADGAGWNMPDPWQFQPKADQHGARRRAETNVVSPSSDDLGRVSLRLGKRNRRLTFLGWIFFILTTAESTGRVRRREL
jgi:hypothetical protein